MLEFASAIKITIFALLLGNFIAPTFLAVGELSAVAMISSIALALVKIVLAMAALAVLESVIAKMRFYRMQEYLTGAFFLGLSGMIMALVAKIV